MRILVINCGSTTLKYKLYEAQEQDLSLLAAAMVPMKAGDEAPIAGVLAALPAPPDAVAPPRGSRRRSFHHGRAGGW